MTQNQLMGILRAVVPAMVAYLVAKGWVSDSNAADVGAAIITIGSAVWSVVSNMEPSK